MEEWGSNPGTKTHRDETMGRFLKLGLTSRRLDPQLVRNALLAVDQVVHEPYWVRVGSGSLGSECGDGVGKSENKGKGLLIDLNEPTVDEDLDMDALLAPPLPPPPPALPVDLSPLEGILKAVRGFGMDLGVADEEGEMDGEQGWLAQQGCPIPVMHNLGGLDGEAGSSGGHNKLN